MSAESDPAEPVSKPDDQTARGRSRRCQALFVIGSGFNPTEKADALTREFRGEHESLDFSQAETIVTQGKSWQPDDKAGFKKSIAAVVRKWCRKQSTDFDARRLLVSDYRDDQDRLYAVASYFPRRKSGAGAAGSSGTSQAEAGHADTADHADHADQADQADQAEDAEDATDGDAERASVLKSIPGRAQFQRGVTFLREQPPKRRKMAGGILALLILLPTVVMFIPEEQTIGTDRPGGESVTEEEGTDDAVAAQRQLPPPGFATGILRVYTPEPGFKVLIDGEPVRNIDGEFATTPCAVTTEQGARSVTVFREGYLDQSRVVDVSEDGEATFEPSADRSDNGSQVLNAPHLKAPVGEPIALKSINSPRPELDPYLTPDQLSIWFVGDREDGRGIFVATRPSPWHDFDEPRIVSRSADMPATPSITEDSLYVVYAVPEKARLMALARSNPLAGFDAKKPLRHSRSLAPTWTSSQMLGNGLRLYWVEELEGGKVRTLASRREKRSDDFGKTYIVRMPGTHPCLSEDGLRQYTFDGSVLKRHRRTSPSNKFTEDAVIAELELPNYTPSNRHRQFFVSDDEQWLFYADDPASGGDLYMVRISVGPQWGVKPRGKSIPPKPVVVAEAETETEDEAEMTEEPEPEPEPVDPRTIPLPYATHRQIFKTLLASRQYDQVDGLLRSAKTNPEMERFSEQIAWDEDDFRAIQGFRDDLKRVAEELPRGEVVRLGTLRLEVTGFENGELVGERGGTEIRKELTEMSVTELASLFDEGIDRDDAEAQYRFAVMLFYDGESVERARKQRFELAGELADRFQERRARRKLALAKAELDRTNFGQGVALLKETIALAEGTPVAAEAQSLESELYKFVKWRQVGPREWKTAGSAWEAGPERADGSLLLSEKQYSSFELSLEWKVLDTLTAQGGVYFHYPGRGVLTEVAHKIHLANDPRGGADMYSTGSLFADEAPDAIAAKPTGEWNTLRIKVVGKAITVHINDRQVLDTEATKDTVPDRGYIALDGEIGGIAYRKILLSEVPE